MSKIRSSKLNIDSKEFIPKAASGSNNEEQLRKITRLAKKLNNLGVLDDGHSEEDSQVNSSFGNSNKSPTKSDHNSSISSGFGTSTSIVSSLTNFINSPIGHDDDDPKTVSKTITVPTSEHVAEIVGKQGCKIKALRAKTNTYIKTPVRGEAPAFVITGHKNDVENALTEIKEAADHFTMIRQQRNRNNPAVFDRDSAHGMTQAQNIFEKIPFDSIDPALIAKQITLKVRVPYNVVGLVVGPKGSTIKRIQQTSQTYIVTPSREKEPVFEVTGLRENVEKARDEIQSHIANRTGANSVDPDVEFMMNGKEADFEEQPEKSSFEASSPPYRKSSISTPAPVKSPSPVIFQNPLKSQEIKENSLKDSFSFSQKERTISEDDEDGAIDMLQNLTDDERVLLSKVIEEMKSSQSIRRDSPKKSIFEPDSFSVRSTGPSINNCLIGKAEPPKDHHESGSSTKSPIPQYETLGPLRPPQFYDNFRAFDERQGKILLQQMSHGGGSSAKNGVQSVQGVNRAGKCLVCKEKMICMALVPCGHNLFCEDCALMITQTNKNIHANPVCPECFEPVNMAIKIHQ